MDSAFGCSIQVAFWCHVIAVDIIGPEIRVLISVQLLMVANYHGIWM